MSAEVFFVMPNRPYSLHSKRPKSIEYNRVPHIVIYLGVEGDEEAGEAHEENRVDVGEPGMIIGSL